MKIKGAKILVLFLILALTFIFNPSLYAAEPAAASPTVTTTLTDKVSDDQAVGEKSVFTKDTPMIYLTFQSDDVVTGQIFKSVWICDNSNKVAPDNYKIDESSMPVPAGMKDGESFSGKFSISKPTSGWPVGTYHVDVYADNKVIKTVKFSVQ